MPVSGPLLPRSLLVVLMGSWTLLQRRVRDPPPPTPGQWSPWPHAWWAEKARLGFEVGEAEAPGFPPEAGEQAVLFPFLVHGRGGSGLRAEA